MKKMSISKMSVILAGGCMLCLASNVLADPVATTQATVVSGVTSLKQTPKTDKRAEEMQKKIAFQEEQIAKQEKKISDLTANSAKPNKISKEKDRLTEMQNNLARMQKKADGKKGSKMTSNATTAVPTVQKQ